MSIVMHRFGLHLALVALFGGSAAQAAPAAPQEVTLPPAPGLHALTVRIDAGTVQLWTCPNLPCSTGSFSAVTLASKLPGPGTLEVVPIGDGKRIVHVRVPLENATAWEAIVSGNPSGPIVFSGKTGLLQGQDGERTGQMVQIFDDGPSKVVMVADVREDLRICDQTMTPLSPRVLDPKTLELRGATVPRLSRAQRAEAKEIVATAHAGTLDPPVARLLVALGASSALTAPQNLVDGNPSTAWAEARGGDGHGEFVLLRAPNEVPISRLAIVPSPAAASAAKTAAPRRFYLVTPDRTIAVTMPEDAALHPGRAYDVALSEPIKSSCLSLVLEDAYTQGQSKPDVTIAELYAYSELEAGGAAIDAIARELGVGGARAQAAAGILKRAGADGAKAVLGAIASLDPAGRGLAVEVASSLACDEGAPVLIAELADRETELARRARTKLERCGKSAAQALALALASNDFATRARVAPILGSVAPSAAIDPLVNAMGQGPGDVRAEVRGAFARAARSASREKLASLVSDTSRPALARIDLLRALGDRLPDVALEAKAQLDTLLASNADFATRYLTLQPISVLARNDPTMSARLEAAIEKDEAWPVRARAAELSFSIEALYPAIVRALGDPEPRVREAALRAIGAAKITPAAVTASTLLQKDPWTFVRSAASSSLGAMPAAPDIDAALATAAKTDEAPSVRASALESLGAHRARNHSSVAIEALSDKDEDPDVRVAAAHALARMCESRGLDALTSAARFGVSPVASLEDLTVATAALRALGAIHPADIASRLAPLLEGDVRAEMRRAAQSAIQEKGSCP